MRVSAVVSIWMLVLVGCSDAHLNLPPVVADLAIEAMEDTVATATLDATDPDRDGLLIEVATPPVHGVLEIEGKTLTYTPESNFHGDDELTVTVYDTKNPRETATVSITVLPVNDSPVGEPDNIAAVEDVPRTIATSALLQNDTDIDLDTLTITAVASGTHGTVALSGANVVFTPELNFGGEASFEYTLSDGSATTAVAVTVDVGGDNDAPVATNDAATTAEDTPINLTTLLANDTDADGQVLTIDSATAVSGGEVGVSGNTVTFTPAANFNGTATFTYVVTDGVASDTGTVTVTVTPVNDAPVASSDSGTTNEDTPVTFSNLAGNDTDVDVDTLTVTAVTGAVNGSVVLNGGSPIFTPAANYNGGAASFDYTVSDGNGGTDTATVTITVSAVNDSPIAVDDSDSTSEDTPIVFTTLVDNDTDPEGDSLSITSVSNFSNCVVAFNGGSPIFTPDANFVGTASFTYTVSDGNGGTDVGSVSVNVAAAPDVSSVTPSTVSVLANGGTAILTVTLDAPAGAGGLVVDLASSSSSNLAVPSTVTVPAGATSVTFRARADATSAAGPFTITATLDGVTGSATSSASIVTTAPAPVLGDLVINEIHYDVLTTGAGDANCDGVNDAQDDEFVEISNRSSQPVQLQGVSLWDAAAFAGSTPVYSFPSFILGPNETVVVFSGSVGTTGTSVWCTNLDGTHIGDARAFAGTGSFALNNTGGDVVHLTATSLVTSTELVSAVSLPTTSSKQAYVRNPDFTGAFVKDGTGIGATDRNWSPGTLVTGLPFASASP